MSDAANKPVGPGEAARRLGVSTRTVQRWLREGKLPSVRIGSRVKVDVSAFSPADISPEPSSVQRREIQRVLVANRGELVVRIARTCRRLGIRCLALVAADHARAWWTGATDEIVPLRGTYLDADSVLHAARAAGADAIHPGYGFLAENADFADAVANAGLVWVGPPASAMRALGDKAAARHLAVSLGVPVLAGYDGADQTDSRLEREADSIGYPVLVKPSAGGGGKGMHVLPSAMQFEETVASARREAAAAFGDERLILERYLPRPRHIEVQFLADAFGNAVHLGERECSLQRRHQKVIEEAPSPAVDEPLRTRLGEAALGLARAGGYVGAGTAEFLLDEAGAFYFLEVNARLQVEHPVTELVTGRDLVADQLRIAAGRALAVRQSEIQFDGHAIEARLYAEDPYAGFLPATGQVIDARLPALEGVRIDAGVGRDDVIGTRYDPLLAKLIAHGADRAEAIRRLDTAVEHTHILGVTTNLSFLRWLLADDEVIAGRTYTTLIDERWHGEESLSDLDWQLAAAALVRHVPSAAAQPIGFRLNAPRLVRVAIGEEERTVELPGGSSAVAPASAAAGNGSVVIDLDGRSVTVRLAPAPTVESAARHAAHERSGSERVTAPMPGTIINVRVADGDEVDAGQVLVVLEAMKMENTVPAPAAGRVERVLVSEGQQVQRGEALVELA